MIALSDVNAVCTARQLGEIVGVTDRHIQQLTRDGVLKCVRNCKLEGGRRYRLAESVQAFGRYQCALVAEEAASRNGEYEKARTRRMAAVAEQAELDLQVKKGKLHRQDDLEFWLGLLLGSTRDKLLGVPNKVMHSLLGLSSPAEANRIVAEAIELALIDLSKAKLSDFKKQSDAYLRSTGITPEVIAAGNGQTPPEEAEL